MADSERRQVVVPARCRPKLLLVGAVVWLGWLCASCAPSAQPASASRTDRGRPLRGRTADSPPAPAPPAAARPPPPDPAAASLPTDAPPHPRPLFRRYPALEQQLPWTELADLPTPIERMPELAAAAGLEHLYVKRDDQAGHPIGGSKVRKLELLLADARRRGKSEVVTFGGFGSNHAVATAMYGERVGLPTVLMLLPEPNTPAVRHNLLASLSFGATLRLGSNDRIDRMVRRWQSGALADGDAYVIVPGGSSPLGNVGFVNAALELAEQIEAGQLPAPAVVYVALGTMGACVGLALGLSVAGLHETELRCVRVSTPKYATERKLQRMLKQTGELLESAVPSLHAAVAGARATMVQGYVGRGYAMPTAKGRAAMRLARDHGGLELDATYTSKALAALLDDAEQLRERVVLFWHTYDARRLDLSHVSPARLPPAFRGYFGRAGRHGPAPSEGHR